MFATRLMQTPRDPLTLASTVEESLIEQERSDIVQQTGLSYAACAVRIAGYSIPVIGLVEVVETLGIAGHDFPLQ